MAGHGAPGRARLDTSSTEQEDALGEIRERVSKETRPQCPREGEQGGTWTAREGEAIQRVPVQHTQHLTS